MRFTYDTESDSISSPDLNAEQTAKLQAILSAALTRDAPVQEVTRALQAAASR